MRKSLVIKCLVIILVVLFGKVLGAQSNEDFKSMWNQIEKLEREGLSKTALEVADRIYELSEKDNAMDQKIKSLFYIGKYEQTLIEDSEWRFEQLVKKEIAASAEPYKSYLQSILAEYYLRYLINNAWAIAQRTEIQERKPEDFRTWSVAQIDEEMFSLFKASLLGYESLGNQAVEELSILLSETKKYDRGLRPLHFDFLANRLINSLRHYNTTAPVSKNAFQLKDERLFAKSDDFVKANFQGAELDKNLLIIKTLQTLEKRNRSKSNLLVDNVLTRLEFLQSESGMAEKQSEYELALRAALEDHSESDESLRIAHVLAQSIQNKEPLQAEEILNKALSKHSNGRYAPNCRSLLQAIQRESIDLNFEQVVPNNRAALAQLNYRNVKKVYFRLIELDEDEFFKLNYSNQAHQRDWKVKFLLDDERKNIKQWNLSLPFAEDRKEHAVEVAIPAMELGKYAIIISSDPDFSKKDVAQYISWQVSDLLFLHRNPKTNEGLVLDRNNGEEMAKVQVTILKEEYERKTRQTKLIKVSTQETDKNGKTNVVCDFNRRSFIELQKGNDHLLLQEYFNERYPNEPNKNDQLRLFTDRSIYRPGQEVFFKGLLLRPQNKQYQIVEDESVKVILRDTNHEEIATKTFTTNDFGSFNGSFELPIGRINGTYYLQSDNGAVSIKVEEYKRPKFEVKLDQPKSELKLNQEVTVEGTAKSYVGLPIADAQVTYRVVREPYIAYWCWFYRYPPRSEKIEIANGELITDPAGKFSISFNALAEEDRDYNYTYRVYADITDSNGETRSDELNIRIGNKSMFIRIEMPDLLVKGEKAVYEVEAINLNEQKLEAELTYEIFEADPKTLAKRKRQSNNRVSIDSILIEKADFERDFPQYAFITGSEKAQSVATGKLSVSATSSLEIKELDELKPGKYVLVVKGIDQFGAEAVAEREFAVLQKKEGKAIPLSWFYSDLKDGRVLSKERGKLLLGSPYDIKVHVVVTDEKGLAFEKRIDLNNTQELIDLGLPKSYTGKAVVQCLAVWENEVKELSYHLELIEREPKLNYTLRTFRDNLRPGEKEKWQIIIDGPEGEKVAAELLTAMYDASLDAFLPHNWEQSLNYDYWLATFHNWRVAQNYYQRSNDLVRPAYKNFKEWYEHYPELNWFGFHPHGYGGGLYLQEVVVSGYGGGRQGKRNRAGANGAVDMKMAAPMVVEEEVAIPDWVEEPQELADESDGDGVGSVQNESAQSNEAPPKVSMRTNLQETAFFFPELRTNEKGEIVLEFEAPEALTKWKWMNFAHSKDLDYAFWTEEVVTKKELMVTPNAPRFFRQGDQLYYSAKVSNMSDQALSGKMYLDLVDPLTEKSVNHLFKLEELSQDFNLDPDESSSCDWYLDVPEGISALTCKVIADSGVFSDGEATTVPVLTDRVLVTETLPMPQRKAGSKTFTLDKLLGSSSSSTIQHHRVSLEYASNPSWYAVQALPSLMEYPYKCSEQIFNRMYANALAAHITDEYPAIEKVFAEWKASSEEGGEDLLSNLEKNQELKSAILEETPWLRDAKSDSERKRSIAKLFDEQQVQEAKEQAVKELGQRQLSSGGWTWFGGKRPNRFITQYIVTGFGHLKHLGVKEVDGTNTMVAKAIDYMDEEMFEQYKDLKKNGFLKTFVPNRQVIQYLYARSFYKDIAVSGEKQGAYKYFYRKAKEDWLKQNFFLQGMIALVSHRSGDDAIAQKILASLKDNMAESEEMGLYFKNIGGGYYWAEAPIERHALLVEAFQEINQDQDTVDQLKTWLLKQKQVQDWKTTKATADACYALILTGGDWLAKEQKVEISVGQEAVSFGDASAGTGYVKQDWSAAGVLPEMGTVTVSKEADGVSWGALYWQYFEKMEKVEQSETPLSIKKDLFKEVNTEQGPQLVPLTKEAKLQRGDLVKVRIEIRVDRDMEFVHLKDQRSSGFEPVDVLSEYKYQDRLGYYQMVRDANTNFFFDHLPKGIYVFEYPLRVFHKGDFSNGISTIQCMYAPEFSSHSKGVRVSVGEE